MEPASTIVRALGGPTIVAKIAGVHRTRVSNWCRPREKGGTGGNIPFKHVPALIEAARSEGMPLSADDFLPNSGEGSASAALTASCMSGAQPTVHRPDPHLAAPSSDEGENAAPATSCHVESATAIPHAEAAR